MERVAQSLIVRFGGALKAADKEGESVNDKIRDWFWLVMTNVSPPWEK